ncbi:MAG: zinc-ribbon domain-containing protein, partial [Mycobacterium sp.]
MTAPEHPCPHCAAPARDGDRFCGNCGAIMADVHQVAIPRRAALPDGPCADCGNQTFVDGYCTACGSRRIEPDRDEAQVGRVALITDRGVDHARNEDAAAAGIVGNFVAVAVCDGVSSS